MKKRAIERWKPVADWLKRHGIDWCGVWQQQKRGAWHHHFVVNKRIEVVGFRAFVVARGWGAFVNMEKVGPQRGARRFQDPRHLVKYLTRYLTRDFCGHVPGRVRLTSGRADNKVGTTRFQWVNGLGKAWRAGCEDFLRATKINPLNVAWSQRDHIMRRGEPIRSESRSSVSIARFADYVLRCRGTRPETAHRSARLWRMRPLI